MFVVHKMMFLFSYGSGYAGINKGAHWSTIFMSAGGRCPAFVCFSVLPQGKVVCCEFPSQAASVSFPGSGAYNKSCSPVSVAILGMHTLMSNQQYYEALGSSTIVNKEGLNSK